MSLVVCGGPENTVIILCQARRPQVEQTARQPYIHNMNNNTGQHQTDPALVLNSVRLYHSAIAKSLFRRRQLLESI